MEILRNDVAWEEIAESWHRGELRSERFGSLWRDARAAHPHATASDLLGHVRGWPDHDYFQGFPSDVKWYAVALSPRDLQSVLYIDWEYWNEVTAGTRRPLDAITRMGWTHAELPAPDAEPLILVTEALSPTARLVVLEGHARLTRYVAAQDTLGRDVQAYLGVTPAMCGWGCY